MGAAVTLEEYRELSAMHKESVHVRGGRLLLAALALGEDRYREFELRR